MFSMLVVYYICVFFVNIQTDNCLLFPDSKAGNIKVYEKADDTWRKGNIDIESFPREIAGRPFGKLPPFLITPAPAPWPLPVAGFFSTSCRRFTPSKNQKFKKNRPANCRQAIARYINTIDNVCRQIVGSFLVSEKNGKCPENVIYRVYRRQSGNLKGCDGVLEF